MVHIKFFLSFLFLLFPNVCFCELTKEDEEKSIIRLKEYLEFRTLYPEPDYEPAIEWIENQAREIKLKYQRINFTDEDPSNKFGLILTWEGRKPTLPTLLLYSHIDVVNVNRENWKHDPFGSDQTEEGFIFGRGTQDMKSIGIQYLEGIRQLKKKRFAPTRSIHIVFLPDEERGGQDGIKLFVNTTQFKNLHVGFALDEGQPNEDETLGIFYTERRMLWMKFIASGPSGHGSLLLNNTAGEKLMRVINTLMSLREHEKLRLRTDSSLKLGEVTSLNLNILDGGTQINVLPSSLTAMFDIRLTPNWDLIEFLNFLNETCRNAGEGVTYEFTEASRLDNPNPTTDVVSSSWWLDGLEKAFEVLKLKTVARVYPAGTDGIVLRRLGIPVIGMTPIFNTTNLMHANDEYITTHDFIQGIQIYETIIEQLTNTNSANKIYPNPKDFNPDNSEQNGNPFEVGGKKHPHSKHNPSSSSSLQTEIQKWLIVFLVMFAMGKSLPLKY